MKPGLPHFWKSGKSQRKIKWSGKSGKSQGKRHLIDKSQEKTGARRHFFKNLSFVPFFSFFFAAPCQCLEYCAHGTVIIVFLRSYLQYRLLRIYTAPRCGLSTPSTKSQSGRRSAAFYPLMLTRGNLSKCPPPICFRFTGIEVDGKQCVLRQRIASEVDNHYDQICVQNLTQTTS